jgi:hypothetical protein
MMVLEHNGSSGTQPGGWVCYIVVTKVFFSVIEPMRGLGDVTNPIFSITQTTRVKNRFGIPSTPCLVQ